MDYIKRWMHIDGTDNGRPSPLTIVKQREKWDKVPPQNSRKRH